VLPAEASCTHRHGDIIADFRLNHG
jgi:hypothetical protein